LGLWLPAGLTPSFIVDFGRSIKDFLAVVHGRVESVATDGRLLALLLEFQSSVQSLLPA